MMRRTLNFGSPLPNGWTTLEDENRYWDRFTDRFGFRPGITESTWPAIAEPTPSVTFDLTAPADIAGSRLSRRRLPHLPAGRPQRGDLRASVGEDPLRLR